MDVICAYFTPKNLNFFDKFLIYFIKKISLVQSIIGAIDIRGSWEISAFGFNSDMQEPIRMGCPHDKDKCEDQHNRI